MKKLMYLLVAGSLSVFAACGGACSTECAKECCTVEEVVAGDVVVEEVAAEAVGCQVEGGTCLEDHSCCAPAAEATCCCGDEACDGSCHGEEGHAHEHEHSDGESHNHDHDHSDGEGHDHNHE